MLFLSRVSVRRTPAKFGCSQFSPAGKNWLGRITGRSLPLMITKIEIVETGTIVPNLRLGSTVGADPPRCLAETQGEEAKS